MCLMLHQMQGRQTRLHGREDIRSSSSGNVMGLGAGAFGRRLGLEGRDLTDEINALIKEA